MIIRIRGVDAPPVAPKGFSAKKVEALKKQVEKTAPVKDDDRLDSKHRIGIRLDPEVIAFFKRGGPGWQSRINLALRGLAGLENRVENSAEEE